MENISGVCKDYWSVIVEEFGGCNAVDYMQTDCGGGQKLCRYREEIEEVRIGREI